MLDDIKQKKSAIYHPPVGKNSYRTPSKPKVYTEHKIQFGKRISYEEFKAIPVSMKEEYIADMKERYPTLSFSKFALMLGIRPGSLRFHLKSVGINRGDYFKSNTVAPGYMEDNKRFLIDMGMESAVATYGKNKKDCSIYEKYAHKDVIDNHNTSDSNIDSASENNETTEAAIKSIPVSVSLSNITAKMNAADVQAFIDSLGITGDITITINI